MITRLFCGITISFLLASSVLAADDFAKGTWTFQTYGSGTFGDYDHGQIYTFHIGGGYHFQDDLSVNLEAFGGAVDPGSVSGDDEGGVGGLDLLLRWHFHKEENYTFYIDGGAGIQFATTNFPSDSHHNFRPQAGIGMTWKLKDDVRLMTGVRWLHVSNAGTTAGNDGLDTAQIYAGLMFNF